jgi:predicted Zn finger-like uncharacterized protein
MSLITRCPACQTSFRIVTDQLRVSEGWVRCGQCQEVFNAALQLLQEAPHIGSKPLVTASSDAVAATAGVPVSLVLPGKFGSDAMPASEPRVSGYEPESEEPYVDSIVPSEFLRSPDFELGSEAVPSELLNSEFAGDSQVPSSFLRDIRVERPAPKTWVRVIGWLLFLGLLLILGLQILVHERNRIAGLVPESKPALNWACGVLGCEVAPLQQIESIVIDSSSFTKLRPDTYRLAVVIKNNAAIKLAMPSLELTLTDSQDQATLRRTFTVNEMGSNTKTLAANAEWATMMTVNVRAANGAERFTGYRVLVFYP